MAFDVNDQYTLEVLFNSSECTQLLNCGTGDWYNSKFKFGDAENFTTDQTFNNGKQKDVDLTALNALLNAKSLPSVTYAKLEKYGVGEFFSNHSDCSIDEIDTYKTIVIWLSDPNQYAGGDFLIREDALDRSQGNVLQKQSWLRNSVASVNSGEVIYLICMYEA